MAWLLERAAARSFGCPRNSGTNDERNTCDHDKKSVKRVHDDLLSSLGRVFQVATITTDEPEQLYRAIPDRQGRWSLQSIPEWRWTRGPATEPAA